MFSDKALERIVREALGKPDGVLTTDDLLTVEVIAPTCCAGVCDLSELQYCKNLKRLALWDDYIRPLGNLRKIDVLAHLPRLREISLVNYRFISDLSPLAKLIDLEVLDLAGNAIEEISVLSGLTSLRVLRVGVNPIADLSPINYLTELTELDIPKLAHNLNFSAFTKLQSLNISFSDSDDLKYIADAKQLSKLHICANSVDVSCLSHLKHLKELSIAARAITGLDSLSQLKKLEVLRIWHSGGKIDEHMLPSSLRELFVGILI